MTSGAIPDPASVLEALFRRRLIVVTGKGGTGKTSLGAALARLAAAAGKRVLACEVGRAVDSPSPLLGLLAPERTAKNEPQALDGTLSHVVLRGDDGVRQFLGDVMPFQFMANRALKVEAVRRFLDAAPAFGEMGVLYRGQKYLEERRRDGSPVHELMILDAPASGHTLAFASLPDTILKVFTAGPIATAARAGIELIRDPVSTTVVAATLP
ncbi:MAG: arsenic transporter, partial [Deltaproteobacteria bacterium]|nr:arsenic transporter [Deltaproteobacteria bacterium]